MGLLSRLASVRRLWARVFRYLLLGYRRGAGWLYALCARVFGPQLTHKAFTTWRGHYGKIIVLAALAYWLVRWRTRSFANVITCSDQVPSDLFKAAREVPNFVPPVWAQDGHTQSWCSALSGPLPYGESMWYRLRVPMDNFGGYVALDWLLEGLSPPFDDSAPHQDKTHRLDGLHPHSHGHSRRFLASMGPMRRQLHKRGVPVDRPVLLAVPGLTGGSRTNYVQWACQAANERGWSVCVFNARGCGGSTLGSGVGFCGAGTDDLRRAIFAIRQYIRPDTPLYLIAFSLGAGITHKYLGEEGRDRRFYRFLRRYNNLHQRGWFSEKHEGPLSATPSIPSTMSPGARAREGSVSFLQAHPVMTDAGSDSEDHRLAGAMSPASPGAAHLSSFFTHIHHHQGNDSGMHTSLDKSGSDVGMIRTPATEHKTDLRSQDEDKSAGHTHGHLFNGVTAAVTMSASFDLTTSITHMERWGNCGWLYNMGLAYLLRRWLKVQLVARTAEKQRVDEALLARQKDSTTPPLSAAGDGQDGGVEGSELDIEDADLGEEDEELDVEACDESDVETAPDPLAGIAWDKALAGWTVRQFDRNTVVPSFGFVNEIHYYKTGSARNQGSIQHVDVPLLAMNAADDPICHVSTLPSHDFHCSPMALSLVTPCGGHVAWQYGIRKGGPMYGAACDWLEKAGRWAKRTVYEA